MFITDPKTNQVLINLVQPSDYPLLLALLALGIALPIISATAIVGALFFSMRKYLLEYRSSTLVIEMTMKNLSAVLAGQKILIEVETVPLEDVELMRGRTSFFYM